MRKIDELSVKASADRMYAFIDDMAAIKSLFGSDFFPNDTISETIYKDKEILSKKEYEQQLLKKAYSTARAAAISEVEWYIEFLAREGWMNRLNPKYIKLSWWKRLCNWFNDE